MRIHYYREV